MTRVERRFMRALTRALKNQHWPFWPRNYRSARITHVYTGFEEGNSQRHVTIEIVLDTRRPQKVE